MSSMVSILCYHQVAPVLPAGFERYSVTIQQFVAQLRWLKLAGYRTISFDQLLAARTGQRIPQRSVIITFDDGLQDCVEYAAPLLAQQAMSATFFLVAGLMGADSRWLLAEGVPSMPITNWEHARELLRAGMSCGAHGFSHSRLAALEPAQCQQELVDSKKFLETELGSPIKHLAYPFGSWNAMVRTQVAAAGFATACTTEKGRVSLADDFLSLHRIPVYSFETLADFALRIQTGYSLRELVQRWLHRAKKR